MLGSTLRSFSLLAASTVVMGFPVVAQPAAAAPASLVLSFTASSSDPTDRYRTLVRRLADNDPRWEVQTAAWSALISDVPTAVTDFLSPGGGYEKARARASQNASRNNLVISRTISTTTATTSPIVHLTAVRASYGTLAEKDRYVRTGLKEAQDLDAKHSPVEQAKQQAQQDRDYVADMAVHGSGAWVRAAAQRALQKGTDNDIQEFFKYAWASAADCDLQAFRMNLLEQDLTYRHRLAQLIVLAQQAQQAYEQASEAARAKAAAEAKLAWNTAADTAAATQASWLATQQLATAQAESWQQVYDFAVAASTQQDWPAIAADAAGTSASWSDEVAWAQNQAAEWTALYESTKASAEAIPASSPTSSPSPTPAA
ncbi:ALF repeat-containing protein [Micromonospora zamorensis]|uniref:ALF repeat-containing protein n=1 Tax=Micromonospora zamorensis TaxID=709883 RepID=UPI003D98BB6E